MMIMIMVIITVHIMNECHHIIYILQQLWFTAKAKKKSYHIKIITAIMINLKKNCLTLVIIIIIILSSLILLTTINNNNKKQPQNDWNCSWILSWYIKKYSFHSLNLIGWWTTKQNRKKKNVTFHFNVRMYRKNINMNFALYMVAKKMKWRKKRSTGIMERERDWHENVCGHHHH